MVQNAIVKSTAIWPTSLIFNLLGSPICQVNARARQDELGEELSPHFIDFYLEGYIVFNSVA